MISQKPKIYDAIRELVGGNLAGDTDSFESTQYLDGQKPPTKKQAEDKLTELQAEYDALAYSRKREAEYPSIQECVHAILDDDLTALQEKRQAIKTKYPKS